MVRGINYLLGNKSGKFLHHDSAPVSIDEGTSRHQGTSQTDYSGYQLPIRVRKAKQGIHSLVSQAVLCLHSSTMCIDVHSPSDSNRLLKHMISTYDDQCVRRESFFDSGHQGRYRELLNDLKARLRQEGNAQWRWIGRVVRLSMYCVGLSNTYTSLHSAFPHTLSYSASSRVLVLTSESTNPKGTRLYFTHLIPRYVGAAVFLWRTPKQHDQLRLG